MSTLWVHLGEVQSGELRVGDTVDLAVDADRRNDIRRNHSATHLLHWALRHVLGTHVTQKGSLVAPDRLRFDFSHSAPLTDEERQRVEDLVNERVRENAAADTAVLPIADAKQAGAIAFFGEKYGDTVRVVTMGESKEFCGGTHVARTGDIAFFLITEEAGVAQGVRRIEAVTGAGALGFVRRLEGELGETGKLLRAGSFEVAARVAKLQAEQREQQKEIEALRRKLASGGGRDLASEARDVGGVRVLATRVDGADVKALREVADQQRDKLRLGRDRPGRRRGRQDRARVDGDARSGGQVQRRQDRRRGGEGDRRQGRRPRPTWRRGAGPNRSTSTRPWRACSISFVAEPANGVRDRRGGRGRDPGRGAAPAARPIDAQLGAGPPAVHDRQGVRRRRARAGSGAPRARGPARVAQRDGAAARPDARRASASCSRTRTSS